MKEIQEIKLPELTSKNEVENLDIDTFLSNEESIILDIRSELEYNSGHIDRAHSFPLFTNEERAAVGTVYKKNGKDKAVELGLEYVGKRLHLYVKNAKAFGKTKQFYLYCWRGGMRSRSMAWLLSTAGLNVSLLQGGYKAFRQSFIDITNKNWKFTTLLGPTGIGKTELLYELEKCGEQVLDLEGLAHHKGSAFGGLGMQKQPTTEEFINRIHHKLRSFDTNRTVWVEGESIMIGSCFIPKELYDKLLLSDYYKVEMDRTERIDRLTEEYGAQNSEQIIAAFDKITKRMGYDKTKEALENFKSGNIRRAVELALEYYDKGYAMASAKRIGNCLGSISLSNHTHNTAAEYLKNK